jgi:hypothetical protein
VRSEETIIPLNAKAKRKGSSQLRNKEKNLILSFGALAVGE